MKVTWSDSDRFTIEPEFGEDVREIAAQVIVASYNGGSPVGLGFTRAFQTTLTKEMAYKMLDGEDVSHDYPGDSPNKKNEVYMDYVFGRCCKTLVKIEEGRVVGRISSRDQNPKAIIKAVKAGLYK